MKKQVLLVEDDPFHIRVIEECIKKKWPDADCHAIQTEKDFRRKFEGIASAPPNLVIIDQLIPYTSVEDLSDNREAFELDVFRGGSRCYELLRKDPRTARVPVVFFTIMDLETVPAGAAYVGKVSDVELTELMKKVDRAFRDPHPAK